MTGSENLNLNKTPPRYKLTSTKLDPINDISGTELNRIIIIYLEPNPFAEL